jgi:hypothetical protein
VADRVDGPLAARVPPDCSVVVGFELLHRKMWPAMVWVIWVLCTT